MKTFNKILAFGAVALGALALSATASAAVITCDDPADGRKVTLDYLAGATVTCGPSGTTSGGNNEGSYFTGLGFTQLEKIDAIENDDDIVINPIDGGDYITYISGLGGTSGEITLIDGLVNAILVFKFGAGGIEPDWISFYVSGEMLADWSVGPATQALSHVTLYGDRPTQVPEPATLALLGLGLLGLGYRARRRQAV